MAIANLLRSYWRILVAAPVIAAAICFVFVSGPVWSCICGLVIAATLFFLIRQPHQKIYGLIEVIVGLFILYQHYPEGRGAFSSGFGDGFQTFRWNVVLISTITAVYIMVRGLDNIFNPRRK